MRFLTPSLLWTIVRETFGERRLRREPEPDLVMDDPDAVAAYVEAGRREGGFKAVYLFHAARASQVLQGCGRVLDLACGPATQLAEVARLNPETTFIGIDMSDPMLENARAHIQREGLSNVTFLKSDVTRLAAIPDASVDGVMSTVALHHLPRREHLRDCFREIRRVLKPGGAIFLADLGRLKSLKSVYFFAYKEEDQPYLFNLDFERSLRAAFGLEDFQALARELLPGAEVKSTYRVPVFLLVKTADRPLPPETIAELKRKRAALPSRFRGDLDDLRFFYRMGGLENDPFEGPIPGDGARRRMLAFLEVPALTHLVDSLAGRAFRIFGTALKVLALSLRESWRRRRVLRAVESLEVNSPVEETLRAEAMERMGRVLRENLGGLKGPLMKLGQVASVMGHRLPPALREALTPLQDSSAPLATERVREVVERALGRPLKEIFSEWRDTPIAAASISQLHWARLKTGQEVAVKVRYPGIERVVRNDLFMLKLAAPLLVRLTGLSNVRDLLDEIETMVLCECDLKKEAAAQERVRGLFAADPEILIPKAYLEFCAKDVLVMDHVEGRTFAEFERDASTGERDRAARIIGRMTAVSIYGHGMLNADPHPGNYLFLDGRVAFLDFGFVKEWTPDVVETARRLGRAAFANDVTVFTEMARRLGYVKDKGELDYAVFLKALRASVFTPWLEDRPFRFDSEFVRQELAFLENFYRTQSPMRFPKDFLVFHRVFWGHHVLFARLRAEINWHRILVPLLGINQPSGTTTSPAP